MVQKRLLSLSAIGKDKTGIVSFISKILYELGCNIEDSTMTLLSGQFAVILLITYPKNTTAETIKKALTKYFKNSGLSVSVNEADNVSKIKKTKNFGDYIISVYGADKAGIVYKISKYLGDNKINITDVQTCVSGTAKDKVYIMLLEVSLTKFITLEDLQCRMKLLSKELNVDISVNQADSPEI